MVMQPKDGSGEMPFGFHHRGGCSSHSNIDVRGARPSLVCGGDISAEMLRHQATALGPITCFVEWAVVLTHHHDPSVSVDFLKLQLNSFVHHVLQEVQVSHSTVIVALLYIHRFFGQGRHSDLCGPCLFVVALMTAYKYVEDLNKLMKEWAQASGLTVGQLKDLERVFLRDLDFNLAVSDTEFEFWKVLYEQEPLVGWWRGQRAMAQYPHETSPVGFLPPQPPTPFYALPPVSVAPAPYVSYPPMAVHVPSLPQFPPTYVPADAAGVFYMTPTLPPTCTLPPSLHSGVSPNYAAYHNVGASSTDYKPQAYAPMNAISADHNMRLQHQQMRSASPYYETEYATETPPYVDEVQWLRGKMSLLAPYADMEHGAPVYAPHMALDQQLPQTYGWRQGREAMRACINRGNNNNNNNVVYRQPKVELEVMVPRYGNNRRHDPYLVSAYEQEEYNPYDYQHQGRYGGHADGGFNHSPMVQYELDSQYSLFSHSNPPFNCFSVAWDQHPGAHVQGGTSQENLSYHLFPAAGAGGVHDRMPNRKLCVY
eukprot:comp23977_c2_seq1/m.42534 comp23977_c2_seq1/g.42534  ORF comp23977_c2_seq1/g.42534 comp23977_c2_seq1/m.42534 type:complete len:539 (-) comp23977_c2_seq1:737-2353(-)